MSNTELSKTCKAQICMNHIVNNLLYLLCARDRLTHNSDRNRDAQIDKRNFVPQVCELN